MTLCQQRSPSSQRVLCRLPAGHLGACVACLGTRSQIKILAVWSGGTVVLKYVPVEIFDQVMAGLATGRHYWPREDEAAEIEVEEA